MNEIDQIKKNAGLTENNGVEWRGQLPPTDKNYAALEAAITNYVDSLMTIEEFSKHEAIGSVKSYIHDILKRIT